jgi:hypothetical protein
MTGVEWLACTKRKRLWLVAAIGTVLVLASLAGAWAMLQDEDDGNERVTHEVFYEALKELILSKHFDQKELEPDAILGKPSRIERQADGRDIAVYVGKRQRDWHRPVIKWPLNGEGDPTLTDEYCPPLYRKVLDWIEKKLHR